MANPYPDLQGEKWQAGWWSNGISFYLPYYFPAHTRYTLPMASNTTCRLPLDEHLVDLHAIPPEDRQEREEVVEEVVEEEVEIFDTKPAPTEEELLLQDQQDLKTPPDCGLSRAQRIRWHKLYMQLFVDDQFDPEHKRARKELRKLQRLAQLASNASGVKG